MIRIGLEPPPIQCWARAGITEKGPLPRKSHIIAAFPISEEFQWDSFWGRMVMGWCQLAIKPWIATGKYEPFISTICLPWGESPFR